MGKEVQKQMVILPKNSKEWIYALSNEFKNVSFEQKLKKIIDVVSSNEEMFAGKGVRIIKEAKKALETKDTSRLIKVLERL